MFEHPQIRAPVGTLARGVKITQLIVSHAMRASVPRRIQRASPIPPRQRGEESAEVQVQQAGGRPWQEFRVCLCADVPQIRATAASPRPRRGGPWEMSLWLESGAHLRPHMLENTMKSKHFHIGRGAERLGARLRQDML